MSGPPTVAEDAAPDGPRAPAGRGVVLRLYARLAWWLLRGQGAKVWILLACVALGVAGRVCVGTFMARFGEALARESRSMLGGDLELSANHPFTVEELAAVDTALPAGARRVRYVSLVTMAAANGRARPVDLRAVEPGYPLAGAVVLSAGSMTELDGPAPAVAVGADLLRQLEVAPGAHIAIGHIEARIVGTILAEPGVSPLAFGPRVLLGRAQLDAAGIAGSGSRLRHALQVVLVDPTAAEAVASALRQALKLPARDKNALDLGPNAAALTVRTSRDVQSQLAGMIDRFADFLRLVSLIALLLGGIGVASLVRGLIHDQLESIATLRVLGGTRATVLAVFLLQALGIGVVGGLVGALAGEGLQALLAMLAAGALPVTIAPGFDPGATALGVALGAAVAVLAAALPIAAIAPASPLAILRGAVPAGGARWPVLLIGLTGALACAGLAAYETHSLVLGPGAILVLALAAGLIAGGGVLLRRPLLIAGRALEALRAPFALRHGLANLGRGTHRPVAALTAIGLAALLFGTLLVYRAALLAEFDPPSRAGITSLFVIDLQDDQVDEARSLLAARGLPAVDISPLVKARLRAVGTEDAARGPARTREEERGRFMRGREQNLSWRATLGEDEHVVAGTWMEPVGTQLEASLEERFAKRIGARLGEKLRLDVQGVEVEATVTSLRRVSWTSFRPNFFILVSPLALAGAPATWVAAVPDLEPAAKQAVQADLTRAFPNVTVFDVQQMVHHILDLVERIATAVRFIALFALAAGLAVLTGMALASARARRADAALLAVLGARRGTVVAALLVEFAALGAIAAALGAALATGSGWLLVSGFFGMGHFAVPWLQLVGLVAVVAALCAVTGVLACRQVLTAKPLTVLREA